MINLPRGKKKYGEVLAAAFDEVAEYWRSHVLGVSTVTEEAPLRELRLPKNASSRLVFFAVPLHRLPIYRAQIFSSVETLGLVPVTADDVVSPADSVSAKIDALMDRAVAIVVEIGSAWTSAELRLALSRAREAVPGRPPQVIVVGEAPSLFLDIDRLPIIRIISEPESELGLHQLIDALQQVVPSKAEFGEEAKRLLAANENRAAVISAMSLLEDTLRRRLDKPVWSDVRRPMSMQKLIELNFSNQVYPNSARINEWMQLRNKAVHENAPISHAAAAGVVGGVLKLLEQLG